MTPTFRQLEFSCPPTPSHSFDSTMDQDAFRSLLATPARPSGSGPTPSRFGLAPPKRQPAQHKGASTDLKPRKVTSNASATAKPKRNPDGSLYRDRAAERRAGRDSDFADAERLLEDFKARSETAGVSKDVLEDQMKYLGGDEHHSILVKGLDIALLEREKAKLAGKAESELENVEDELDAAFETAATAVGPASPPLPPAAGPSRQQKASNAGPSTKKRAKTRDELIAEMKAMRAGAAGGGGPAVTESRFKPIGGSSVDKKGKGKEGPTSASGGWKAVGADATGGEGEKKKRKKRKVVPAAAAAEEPAAEPATAPAAGSVAEAAAEQTEAAPAQAPLLPSGPPPVVDIDDDFDIFGDAGDYKGLDTDEDEDAGSAAASNKPPPPLPPVSAAGKRKYFDDDDDEEDAIQTSTAPGGMGDSAAKQAAADAAAQSGRAAGGDGADGQADEEAEAPPMRLEGLSGAGPSVKELLEMDKAAEAEEKRQARKLKAKEKAEARRANMTDADKANQDYQKMMSHLEKKDGNKKSST
ncbi:hypothetical protein BMF94_3609 [Rhodotorula taiwanensis]|uniref:RED-like N-terminal domain-containing protein n=1 Tax=Rhodotorula taiwanensis TaxID=741276 RepID=A0A2S5B931_9BASI|nr:hypothetical protein BMF94_3609 [Rhodotorula taiwanensis]